MKYDIVNYISQFQIMSKRDQIKLNKNGQNKQVEDQN